jgi:hypothetical protein
MPPDNHLTREDLQRLLAGVRTPTEAAREASAHLAGCAACRDALREAGADTSRRLAAALLPDDDPEEDCPEPDLLSRYVEGKASPFEVDLVEAHLEICLRCYQNVAHLRALETELAAYAGQVTPARAPAAVALPTPAEPGPVPPETGKPVPSAWERLRGLLLQPQGAWSSAGVFAACLLAMLLFRNGSPVPPDPGLANRLQASNRRADDLEKVLKDNRRRAENRERELQTQISVLTSAASSGTGALSRVQGELDQVRTAEARARAEADRAFALMSAPAGVKYNPINSEPGGTLSGDRADIAPVSPNREVLSDRRPALTIYLSPEQLRREGREQVVLEVRLNGPDRSHQKDADDDFLYVAVDRRTLPASGQVRVQIKNPLPVNAEYQWSLRAYPGKMDAATGGPENRNEPIPELTSESAWFLLLDRQKAADPLERAVILAAGGHRSEARAELTKALRNPRLPAADRRIAARMWHDLRDEP